MATASEAYLLKDVELHIQMIYEELEKATPIESEGNIIHEVCYILSRLEARKYKQRDARDILFTRLVQKLCCTRKEARRIMSLVLGTKDNA